MTLCLVKQRMKLLIMLLVLPLSGTSAWQPMNFTIRGLSMDNKLSILNLLVRVAELQHARRELEVSTAKSNPNILSSSANIFPLLQRMSPGSTIIPRTMPSFLTRLFQIFLIDRILPLVPLVSSMIQRELRPWSVPSTDSQVFPPPSSSMPPNMPPIPYWTQPRTSYQPEVSNAHHQPSFYPSYPPTTGYPEPTYTNPSFNEPYDTY